MNDCRFVYVIYIRTTADALWQALTLPEFTRRYWVGTQQESDWTVGSDWLLRFADGRVADRGRILEIDPPRRLLLSWTNEFLPEFKAEGETRCAIEIEPVQGMVRLSVTHEADRPHKFIDALAQGWPQILSSLKSLLETGTELPHIGQPPPAA